MDQEQVVELQQLFSALDPKVQGSQILVVVSACGREIDWLRRAVVSMSGADDRGLESDARKSRFKFVVLAGLSEGMEERARGHITSPLPIFSESVSDLKVVMEPMLAEFMKKHDKKQANRKFETFKRRRATTEVLPRELFERLVVSEFLKYGGGLSLRGIVGEIYDVLRSDGRRVLYDRVLKFVRGLMKLSRSEVEALHELRAEEFARSLGQSSQKVKARWTPKAAPKVKAEAAEEKAPAAEAVPIPTPAATETQPIEQPNGHSVNGHNGFSRGQFEYPTDLLEFMVKRGHITGGPDDLDRFREAAQKVGFKQPWIRAPTAAHRIAEALEWAKS